MRCRARATTRARATFHWLSGRSSTIQPLPLHCSLTGCLHNHLRDLAIIAQPLTAPLRYSPLATARTHTLLHFRTILSIPTFATVHSACLSPSSTLFYLLQLLYFTFYVTHRAPGFGRHLLARAWPRGVRASSPGRRHSVHHHLFFLPPGSARSGIVGHHPGTGAISGIVWGRAYRALTGQATGSAAIRVGIWPPGSGPRALALRNTFRLQAQHFIIRLLASRDHQLPDCAANQYIL